jgi:phosphatidylserine decarboxylase
MVRLAMQAYCKAYDVDLDDYEVPSAGFATFDAFFTRRLKPGLRPLDPELDAVTSPADGRLEEAGPIEVGSTLKVKGRTYTVAELLADRWAASLYAGGQFAVVYLSPRDYHRVHAPVDGRVNRARHVGGTLYPVNSIGLEYVPKLFARNERVVTVQSASLGTVATVMVGAIGVGRISMSYDARITTNRGRPAGTLDYQGRGPTLTRGGELGRFHLGSTAIVLIGPEHRFRFTVQPGSHVKMGQAVARREERP